MTEPSTIAQSTDESTVAGVRRTSARSRARSQNDDSSPYAHRFRTATAVLVGFAIGAIVIAVAVAVASGGRTAAKSAPWSSWSPPDSGTAAALDIAGHVAPLYRISAVDQLSVVTVVDLESAAASAARPRRPPPAPHRRPAADFRSRYTRVRSRARSLC
jgi:hypothetical protein